MKKIGKSFSRRHVILPVIHVSDREQAIRNAVIASQEGCDGVFLINHDIHYGKLLKIYQEVREKFPDWWIGLNCLDLQPEQVFGIIPLGVSGVWVDNAMIDENLTQQIHAERIKKAKEESGWTGTYFGGTAFKYQRLVQDLHKVTVLAAGYVDVVTTSGPGTGQPPEPQKIIQMKMALGEAPLAIASGITPENVSQYLGYCDAFLVSTGISHSFLELDPALVRKLVSAIR